MSREAKGYTLIELAVVIFLLGLVLVLGVPKLRHTVLADDLRTSVRQILGTARTLRNNAIREHKTHVLRFDIGLNRFWITGADMTDLERTEAHEKAFQLPKSVRILDVCQEMGKKTAGLAEIQFTKKGYIEQSVIHLGADNGRQFTLILSPFLGTITTYDKYVECDEEVLE